MKTIDRYVFGSFLSSFTLAFLVLSFVLTVGLLVQIVGLILDGLPMSFVGHFALVSFPETLQWTMPLALLVSSVLVFSRLSADSEIAAMRACGINLLSVMKGPFLFAVLCTLLGFYINNEVVPRGHELRRQLKTKVSVDTGLDLLEPGRVIEEFPGIKFYFGSKEGNWLHDVVVMDYSQKVERMITASKALVTCEGTDIHLELYQMTIDPVDEEHPTMAQAARFPYVVKNAIKKKTYSKKTKDLCFSELLRAIREEKVKARTASGDSRVKGTEKNLRRRNLSEMKTEFSKRFVFALASLCFVLVGIPLGIKAQRKESTIGMAISLAISLGYYVLVILALSLDAHFRLHPEYLMTMPVFICLLLAGRLVAKNL